MSDNGSECVLPTWAILKEVFQSPKEIFIASPWISSEGVMFLERLRDSSPAVPWELWTRFDVLDWVAGYSDYPALLRALEGIETRRLRLRAAGNLHMKVFWNGEDRALVGSCNMTEGGFAANLEAGVLFQGDVRNLAGLLASCRFRIPEVTISDLQALVKELGAARAVKKKWESLKAEANAFAQVPSKKRREPPYLGLR